MVQALSCRVGLPTQISDQDHRIQSLLALEAVGGSGRARGSRVRRTDCSQRDGGACDGRPSARSGPSRAARGLLDLQGRGDGAPGAARGLRRRDHRLGYRRIVLRGHRGALRLLGHGAGEPHHGKGAPPSPSSFLRFLLLTLSRSLFPKSGGLCTLVSEGRVRVRQRPKLLRGDRERE